MFSTILVPLDGSDLAARALSYATFLTRGLQGRLILFHAASRPVLDSDPGREIDAVLEQDRLAQQLVEDGVPATARAVQGEAGPAIVRAVSELGADLIVMSTHGRGGVGRIVHGSTADHLLRHVSIPIVLITAACDRVWASGRPLRILIPLDGSAFAEEAIAPALTLARSLPAEIWLLRAAEERFGIDALGIAQPEPASEADLAAARQYLEQVAAPVRQSGLRVTVVVEAGEAEDLIVQVAEREAIDLVGMATHGQGGLGRLLLEGMATVVTAGRVPLHIGSVAAGSIRRLRAPMLVVRPASVDGSRGPTAST